MAIPQTCVILTPVAQHIEPACESALRELERRGYTVWRVRGYSAIDVARNRLAFDALAQGYEETFWIDADIGFDPDDVDRLRSHDLPICCGLYAKKGLRELAMHALPGENPITLGAKGGLIEVHYAGLGFMHIRRRVYETMRERLALPECNRQFGAPLAPFFQPLVVETVSGAWYLAEDFAFCERSRRCGFTIMAETRVRLFHFGSHGFSWEEAGLELKRYRTFTYHASPPRSRDS